MKIKDLFARGVTSCGGALDYKNVYIGFVTVTEEAVLNEAGMKLVEEWNQPVAEPDPITPKHRKVRVRKLDDDGLDDDLDSVLGK